MPKQKGGVVAGWLTSRLEITMLRISSLLDRHLLPWPFWLKLLAQTANESGLPHIELADSSRLGTLPETEPVMGGSVATLAQGISAQTRGKSR